MIEGIGSDVLWPLLILLFIFLLITWYSRYHSSTLTRDGDVAVSKEVSNEEKDKSKNIKSLKDSDNNEENGEGDKEIFEEGNVDRPANFRRYYRDRQCPICLNNSTYPVETNCGHMFCAKCLTSYWKQGNWGISAMACPVCRQTVTLIIPCFPTTSSQRSDETRPEGDERLGLIEEINTYNRRFSDTPRSVRDYIRDLPVLLRHAVGEFFSASGLAIIFRLRMILCFLSGFLYLISPLDLLPEAFFGIFGLLDDLIVVLLVAIYASVTYRSVLSHRADETNNATTGHSINNDPSTSASYNAFGGDPNRNLLDIVRDREHGIGVGDRFNDYLFGRSGVNYYPASEDPYLTGGGGGVNLSHILSAAAAGLGLNTGRTSGTGRSPSRIYNALNWTWRNIGSRFMGGPNAPRTLPDLVSQIGQNQFNRMSNNASSPTRNSSRRGRGGARSRSRNRTPSTNNRSIPNTQGIGDESPARNTRSNISTRQRSTHQQSSPSEWD